MRMFRKRTGSENKLCVLWLFVGGQFSMGLGDRRIPNRNLPQGASRPRRHFGGIISAWMTRTRHTGGTHSAAAWPGGLLTCRNSFMTWSSTRIPWVQQVLRRCGACSLCYFGVLLLLYHPCTHSLSALDLTAVQDLLSSFVAAEYIMYMYITICCFPGLGRGTCALIWGN